LLWENWFPCFFCLPIIVFDVVAVPVLCAIKYFLASNNDNDNILNGRVRGDGKQEVNEKGKTNRQKEKTEQGIREESFTGINRECYCTDRQ
jgi:hypothetical protein